MTTPQQRSAEADRVEEVYAWALARVGVGAVADSLAAWQEGVPETGPRSEAWKDTAWKLVSIRRGWLTQLALAYYRLVRALRTGSTVAVPGDEGKRTSVESLRRDFEKVVHEIDLHGGGSPVEAGVQPDMPAVDPDDDKPIRVEPLDGDVEKIIADLESDAEGRLRQSLEATGAERLRKKARLIELDDRAEDVDRARADAHASAGAAQAAAAERITLAAARGLTYNLSFADKNCLGWIRRSKTGTPCGFCAMLLSRGFTERSGMYRSRVTASKNEVGESFHDYCNCVAVPIFFKSQLDSPLFELNRRYAEEWPRVTQGLGGADALSVWRKHVREQQSAMTDAAQEAA